MNEDKNVKVISWLSGIAVSLIAIFSFAISYVAQRDLALAAGIHPLLTYIFPLIIDGFILVASLSVLRNSLVGEGSTYQWVMVGLFTVLSVVFNAAHAHDALLDLEILGLPVTLIPHVTMPLALFFGFEMLMRQIHHAIARAGVNKSLASLRVELDTLSQKSIELENEISEKTAQVAELQQEISRLEQRVNQAKRNSSPAKVRQFIPGDPHALDKANGTRAAGMEQRRNEVQIKLEAGWTVGDLADHFAVDLKTIQRDAAVLGIRLTGRGKTAIKDSTQSAFTPVTSGNDANNLDQPEQVVPELMSEELS